MLPIEQEMVRCPGCALESLAVGGFDGPGRFYFSMVCPGCGLGFDEESVKGTNLRTTEGTENQSNIAQPIAGKMNGAEGGHSNDDPAEGVHCLRSNGLCSVEILIGRMVPEESSGQVGTGLRAAVHGPHETKPEPARAAAARSEKGQVISEKY